MESVVKVLAVQKEEVLMDCSAGNPGCFLQEVAFSLPLKITQRGGGKLLLFFLNYFFRLPTSFQNDWRQLKKPNTYNKAININAEYDSQEERCPHVS